MIEYGKKSEVEIYHEGRAVGHQVVYTFHKMISDKNQVVTEILSALELVTSKKAHDLTITIKTDPETNNIRMVSKEYTMTKKKNRD
jgi:hypothetical protein